MGWVSGERWILRAAGRVSGPPVRSSPDDTGGETWRVSAESHPQVPFPRPVPVRNGFSGGPAFRGFARGGLTPGYPPPSLAGRATPSESAGDRRTRWSTPRWVPSHAIALPPLGTSSASSPSRAPRCVRSRPAGRRKFAGGANPRNAPCPNRRAPGRGRGSAYSRQIPFVKLHPISTEQFSVLLQETPPPMVFFLTLDVPAYPRPLGWAHGESPIPVLPREQRSLHVPMDPGRRRGLDVPQHAGQAVSAA